MITLEYVYASITTMLIKYGSATSVICGDASKLALAYLFYVIATIYRQSIKKLNFKLISTHSLRQVIVFQAQVIS